jgi:pyruvate dehydrogenase E2 component (dihydrolipoyllysine-residue acetyltransferase)
MPTDVIMPQMGESIFEGTLTKWLKKPGEKVNRDEPLFEISTDKVDAEIPSPASGVLMEQKVAEGTTVQVNTVVGVIGDGGGAAASAPAAPKPAEKKEEPRPPVTQAAQQQMVVNPAATGTAAQGNAARDIRSSPLVRRIAKDNNIDLHQVPGTGMGGRITKDDILNFVDQHGKGAAAPAQRPAPAAAPAAPAPAPSAPAMPTQIGQGTPGEVVHMSTPYSRWT